MAILAIGVPGAFSANIPAELEIHQMDAQDGLKEDDRMHPLGEQNRALRKQAFENLLQGQGKTLQNGRVHEVAKGQYVELEREGEDLIFTVLGEFGDIPIYPASMEGPQRNEIPEPDRNVDNTTIWRPDFNREYYEEMLFSEAPGAISMRNFYIEQSSNRYTVDGDVTDWVQVPYDTASYGRHEDVQSNGASDVWFFVWDGVEAWYAAQQSAGMTEAQIMDYLSQFDVWDRYDYDGDGNFDEPDGYIDHYQAVHAGEGEEAGGGAYGEDAIWSHRWYAFWTGIALWGPSFNPAGGVPIGNTGYWIGDYTVEPENGGVGVFAHEYAHDLDLPDLYDTNGGSNSSAFWTLMASGSWTSDGTVDIGSKPTHMGAWEKFQLGWLNYEVAFAGAKSEHKLGPAETNTKQAQGLFVVLPDKEVETLIGSPYDGQYFYYSSAGNDLDNFMYRTFDLAAGSSLNAMVNFNIEDDWDYAYLVVSDDYGATWTGIETNLSTVTDPNGQNFGYGITGSTANTWVALTADLSAYTGEVVLGFRYWTDAYEVMTGFMIDEIYVTGYPVDGAESDAGWTYMPGIGGFHVSDGAQLSYHFNAYLAEFRQYRSFDDALRTGPYNFPDYGNFPYWVERWSYQDGLLISYWDTSQADNNTTSHPGEGLLLPIDAHPEAMPYPGGGGYWSSSKQSYDSTFGLEPTDAVTLHLDGEPSYHPSLPAVPTFDDRSQYWNPETPYAGVMNPHTGTLIRIKSVSAHDTFMQVQVRPAENDGTTKAAKGRSR